MARPMTKPLRVSASGMRAWPTQRIIDAVMRSMPPVCLSASASTEPRTITTAMLWIVRPKPCSKASMNVCRSMPGIRANSTMGTSSDRKTCHLKRVISRKRRATMATRPARATSALSVIIGAPSLVFLKDELEPCSDRLVHANRAAVTRQQRGTGPLRGPCDQRIVYGSARHAIPDRVGNETPVLRWRQSERRLCEPCLEKRCRRFRRCPVRRWKPRQHGIALEKHVHR